MKNKHILKTYCEKNNVNYLIHNFYIDKMLKW